MFAAFVKMARYWLIHNGPGVVVVEELADVTTIGKAPTEWGYLLREAVKRGGMIYCIAQRWAEADKTALSQRTELIVFAQGREKDVEYLADEMRVQRDVIRGLVPEYYDEECRRAKRLPYLRQDRARRVSAGELRF